MSRLLARVVNFEESCYNHLCEHCFPLLLKVNMLPNPLAKPREALVLAARLQAMKIQFCKKLPIFQMDYNILNSPQQ